MNAGSIFLNGKIRTSKLLTYVWFKVWINEHFSIHIPEIGYQKNSPSQGASAQVKNRCTHQSSVPPYGYFQNQGKLNFSNFFVGMIVLLMGWNERSRFNLIFA